MPKNKGSITNVVRTLRFEHGEISQSELAKRVGVSRQTIVAIEKGDYTPSLDLAFRIAYVFGKSINEIFTFHVDKVKGELSKL